LIGFDTNAAPVSSRTVRLEFSHGEWSRSRHDAGRQQRADRAPTEAGATNLKLRMRQSIARALADEMAADPTVI